MELAIHSRRFGSSVVEFSFNPLPQHPAATAGDVTWVIAPEGWSLVRFGGGTFLLSKHDSPRLLEAREIWELASREERGFSIKSPKALSSAAPVGIV